MEKIISFIIPSYNVENCLPVCLDSFLIQESEGFSQLEVIVVDDGSRDRTAEIAGSYVKRFPSVYRLIQKENGGHGSAINVGSQAASGKYMKVVDADDWVVTENLGKLLKKLAKCHSDVVLTPFHQVHMKDGSREIWKMYCPEYEVEYSLGQVLSAYKDFDRCLTFHGIMYRTEFYRHCGHELPEKVFYEDQEYAAIPCCYAKNIYPVNLFLYQYQVGNAQQSVSAVNQVKRIGDIEQVAKDILGYWKTHSSQRADTKLGSSGRELLLKKAEKMILSYYVSSCIFQPDKRTGIRQAKAFTKKIQKISPEIVQRTRKKYWLYRWMCRMHISYGLYEKLMRSKPYRIIRKAYRLEEEPK